MNNISTRLTDIGVKTLQGDLFDWSICKGKKVLIVNTASECGFTEQYEGLQALYDEYQDKLVVIGAPCNQFGKQEPGDAGSINKFCQLNFGVTFPLTEKLNVKGKEQHPLHLAYSQGI